MIAHIFIKFITNNSTLYIVISFFCRSHPYFSYRMNKQKNQKRMERINHKVRSFSLSKSVSNRKSKTWKAWKAWNSTLSTLSTNSTFSTWPKIGDNTIIQKFINFYSLIQRQRCEKLINYPINGKKTNKIWQKLPMRFDHDQF